eukprot:3912361-Rhodomonas_salina.1
MAPYTRLVPHECSTMRSHSTALRIANWMVRFEGGGGSQLRCRGRNGGRICRLGIRRSGKP